MIVYVSSADSGSISVLQLDERSGRLSTLQTIVVEGMLMPMAVSRDKRFLYVARRSEPLAVIALGIDAQSGQLTRLGEATLPASMANISLDASGRWLFSASYGGNLVAVSPISADGLPQPAKQVIPTGPKAHAICSDPSNRFVFATSLGAGQLLQFTFNAASGELVPNTPSSLALRPEAGPRHFVFHPKLPLVYLLNELDASLDVLAFDPERGTLQHLKTVNTLPPGFSGEPWAADLHLTPDGRFLYSSERRSSTLAAFAVDARTGTLTALGHVPTQAQPRGFAITPTGHHLIAAGQLSHRVGVHAINESSGALSLVSEHDVGLNPNWVEAIQLP
ncbi:MAG: lactonase family protein [Cytophagales bacterium]|nr:lactonase family protein [Rhizobacter sp.]